MASTVYEREISDGDPQTGWRSDTKPYFCPLIIVECNKCGHHWKKNSFEIYVWKQCRITEQDFQLSGVWFRGILRPRLFFSLNHCVCTFTWTLCSTKEQSSFWQPNLHSWWGDREVVRPYASLADKQHHQKYNDVNSALQLQSNVCKFLTILCKEHKFP